MSPNVTCFLHKCDTRSIAFESSTTDANSGEKFLGVTFEIHIGELCRKCNQKFHAVSGCTKNTNTKKRRLLF